MRLVGVVFVTVGAGLSVLNGFVILFSHRTFGAWDPVFGTLLEAPAAASLVAGAWLIGQTPRSMD